LRGLSRQLAPAVCAGNGGGLTFSDNGWPAASSRMHRRRGQRHMPAASRHLTVCRCSPSSLGLTTHRMCGQNPAGHTTLVAPAASADLADLAGADARGRVAQFTAQRARLSACRCWACSLPYDLSPQQLDLRSLRPSRATRSVAGALPTGTPSSDPSPRAAPDPTCAAASPPHARSLCQCFTEAVCSRAGLYTLTEAEG